MTTLYIDGPEDGGEGVYFLVADTGECLASHFCSNYGFARGDLEAHRSERQRAWREQFGEYVVKFIGEDELTRDELIQRNEAWHQAELATAQEAS